MCTRTRHDRDVHTAVCRVLKYLTFSKDGITFVFSHPTKLCILTRHGRDMHTDVRRTSESLTFPSKYLRFSTAQYHMYIITPYTTVYPWRNQQHSIAGLFSHPTHLCTLTRHGRDMHTAVYRVSEYVTISSEYPTFSTARYHMYILTPYATVYPDTPRQW